MGRVDKTGFMRAPAKLLTACDYPAWRCDAASGALGLSVHHQGSPVPGWAGVRYRGAGAARLEPTVDVVTGQKPRTVEDREAGIGIGVDFDLGPDPMMAQRAFGQLQALALEGHRIVARHDPLLVTAQRLHEHAPVGDRNEAVVGKRRLHGEARVVRGEPDLPQPGIGSPSPPLQL